MTTSLPCESLMWIAKNSMFAWASHPSLFVCCVTQWLRNVKNSTSFFNKKTTHLGQQSRLILSRRKKHICWQKSFFCQKKWWIEIDGHNFIRVNSVISMKEKFLLLKLVLSIVAKGPGDSSIEAVLTTITLARNTTMRQIDEMAQDLLKPVRSH